MAFFPFSGKNLIEQREIVEAGKIRIWRPGSPRQMPTSPPSSATT